MLTCNSREYFEPKDYRDSALCVHHSPSLGGFFLYCYIPSLGDYNTGDRISSS